MGRPNKKRSAARQREVGKKLKRELTDPLAWTFEDPWRTNEEIPGPTAIGSSMQDIRQPETPICVEEDLPPFPLEPSLLPDLPELPEFDGRWGSDGASPIRKEEQQTSLGDATKWHDRYSGQIGTSEGTATAGAD
ncbi:hypothetical protein RP20_CCG004848 [Aedes albopictus]|nr:hypothetical protein RP20_CCG004848 [Aedes albopictus]